MAHQHIVITGGAGFVGNYLRQELAQQWPEANIISWDLPEVDITKPATYAGQLKELQPKWVVHLAAISSVTAAGREPELTRRVNVAGTEVLLAAIEHTSPNTKVFITSTADIYGAISQAGAGPVAELPLDKAIPTNPYAVSKKAMELLIQEKYAERSLCVRSFPHFGPGQKKGFVTADFASQIAAIEIGRQEPVIQVGNLLAQRDFTDVRDVVRAYRLLMERGIFGRACTAKESASGICGIYHVASGRAVSIQFILDTLLAMSTVKVTVEQDSALLRPSDTPLLVGNAAKLRRDTGWVPAIALKDSLRDILNHWRQRVA